MDAFKTFSHMPPISYSLTLTHPPTYLYPSSSTFHFHTCNNIQHKLTRHLHHHSFYDSSPKIHFLFRVLSVKFHLPLWESQKTPWGNFLSFVCKKKMRWKINEKWKFFILLVINAKTEVVVVVIIIYI